MRKQHKNSKAWKAVYEARLYRHDLIPLLIEKMGENFPERENLIAARAKLCRSFDSDPETEKQIADLEKLLNQVLEKAPVEVVHLFHDAEEKIEKACSQV